MTDLVTVHQPLTLGADGIFAVQGGIPISDAMDAMALLLSTARGAACDTAKTCNDNEASGTAWAVEHLLALAEALNSSMHSGLRAHDRADVEARRG